MTPRNVSFLQPPHFPPMMTGIDLDSQPLDILMHCSYLHPCQPHWPISGPWKEQTLGNWVGLPPYYFLGQWPWICVQVNLFLHLWAYQPTKCCHESMRLIQLHMPLAIVRKFTTFGEPALKKTNKPDLTWTHPVAQSYRNQHEDI